MPVNEPISEHRPAASTDAPPGASAAASPAASPAARWLIATLLLAAAAFDLTRCGLVLAAARHPALAGWLVTAGLAAAAVSIWIARACLARRQWPTWVALLIGAASAPQAAMSGFAAPYTIPDTATAALGVLLAVAVLATAGRTSQGQHAEDQCTIDKEATR